MNRKHFLRLTGMSLAGLMIERAAGNPFDYYAQMALPDEVWIETDGTRNRLQRSNGNKFTFRDSQVSCVVKNGVLSVLVSAPTMALSAVTLTWKHGQPNTSKILNDHWERTYGDVHWQPVSAGKKLPWYFIAHNAKGAECFGVKTGCNTIAFWQVSDQTLQLTLNTLSAGVGVQLGDRMLHAADIVTTKSQGGESLFETGQRFCRLMCDKPRLPKQPVYGINDWYYTYGKNSAELILKHTALLTGLAPNNNNRPFSVIDAGWAAYSPLLPGDCCWQNDYSRPNEHFKDMQKVAADIRKLDMRPGLWMRPLSARHDTAPNRLLPAIEGRTDPKKPVLDPTIQENIEQVKRNISLHKQWGYDLVKHDFSTYDITGRWGFQMEDNITQAGWRFNDNTRTTAEVILHLYRSIRQAAGDMYLIGCNTLSHASAGLFELNRIGDDTSGREWERTRKMGVNTLAFRSIQHNNFYAADADCVGLTSMVPWSKNKQWMQLVAQSGTPLFISAQPEAVGAEQRSLIKESMDAASRKLPVGEPLDWMENIQPAKWKLNGKVITFDWN